MCYNPEQPVVGPCESRNTSRDGGQIPTINCSNPTALLPVGHTIRSRTQDRYKQALGCV